MGVVVDGLLTKITCFLGPFKCYVTQMGVGV